MKGNNAKYIPNYYYSKVENIINHESTHHYHHAYELYYLKEGECNYFIGNQSYKVMSGDVVLIPEGTIHRTNYNGIPHSRLLINCSPEYMPEALSEQIGALEHLYRNSSVGKYLDEIFARIEYEYEHADVLSSEVLRCYTAELFFVLLRNENEYVTTHDERGLTARVLTYIRNNYMNDVKLSAVAAQFSVSAEHLSRTFKKETGFGFNEYLTILRLQKAEYILRNEPGRAVGEVAYACGFNDGNYFSYKFKEAYGVAPTKIKGHKYDAPPGSPVGTIRR